MEAGGESRHREYKGSFVWESLKDATQLQEKVIRGILGFANTPNGGDIVIGVAENTRGAPVLKGLSYEQYSSFSGDDKIMGIVHGFSSSTVNFEVFGGVYQELQFVVIRVQEFSEMPIICKKNGKVWGGSDRRILGESNLYARSVTAPFGTRRVGSKELQDIIQLAVDKQYEGLSRRGYVRANNESDDAYANEVADIL